MRTFNDLISAKWDERKYLCVGLDPDLKKIPTSISGSPRERIVAFNRAIVDATKDIVCAFKPNSAFYEAEGIEGWQALKDTCDYIYEAAPDVPIILDAKRSDIGNTNEGYARMAFDFFRADAITVHPYQGGEALAPFFARTEKGIIVLVKTSNPGSGEFQALDTDGEPLYLRVTRQVVHEWNKNGNCCIVVGATYPHELEQVRAIAPDIPILIPGTGAQGGDLEATVKAAGGKMFINVSRAVLYASSNPDFVEAARAQALIYDGAIRAALL
jgi:orotidine-5'-phosphate decarboxylase